MKVEGSLAGISCWSALFMIVSRWNMRVGALNLQESKDGGMHTASHWCQHGQSHSVVFVFGMAESGG